MSDISETIVTPFDESRPTSPTDPPTSFRPGVGRGPAVRMTTVHWDSRHRLGTLENPGFGVPSNTRKRRLHSERKIFRAPGPGDLFRQMNHRSVSYVLSYLKYSIPVSANRR